MSTKRLMPPSPEVQYLPMIFRRIQQGDIRMPAFQRGFVWKEGQVIELLESVYKGFPIGSVLLWKVESRVLKVEDPEYSFFPEIKEQYPTHFILDGLQRLSTLYSVFHYDSAHHKDIFDIYFDLEEQDFVPGELGRKSETSISLGKIFSPKDFLKRQQELSKLPNSDQLIDRAIELHSTFQEYQLPVVTISGRSTRDVVQVFERINNTGTKLSAVDFLRAVTWSEQFDLNSEVLKLKKSLKRDGYLIPGETLVKVLALALDKQPVAESMLELREKPASELRQGTKDCRAALKRATKYLASSLNIHSYDLVPYEAQLLALAKFFSQEQEPSDAALKEITRWFWTTSFNEELQGRSEHQIAQLITAVDELRNGMRKYLPGQLTLNAATLKERRFRWGTALSSAVASMFAQRQAKSIVSSRKLDPNEFMAIEGGKNFLAILSRKQLRDAVGKDIPAAKCMANLLVCGDADLGNLRTERLAKRIAEIPKQWPAEAKSIFESQFISEEAIAALEAGNYSDFLQLRAKAMLRYAKKLTAGGSSA